MLGVTSHVTLNIAAIPLLWIIPLVLYLLSFILVFAKWPSQFHGAMIQAMPVLLILLVFTMVADGFSIPFGGRILLHLIHTVRRRHGLSRIIGPPAPIDRAFDGVLSRHVSWRRVGRHF